MIKWAQNFCWIKDFSIKISSVQRGWVLFQFVWSFPYLEFIVYGQKCAKKFISISKCEIRKQNQSANMLGNILLTDRSWYGILHYWASRLSERYKDFICETGHWMGIWNYQNWKELLMCEKLISFSTNDCLSPTWGKLFWQVDVILSMLFLLETLTSYIIIYLLNWLHWHQYHLRFLTRFIGPEKG